MYSLLNCSYFRNSFSFSSSNLEITSNNGQNQLTFNQQRIRLYQTNTDELTLDISNLAPNFIVITTSTHFSSYQNIILLVILVF